MRCAVLFSGGKDSGLSLHSIVSRGYGVSCLVVFSNCAHNGLFKNLNLGLVSAAAQALRLPLVPFRLSGNLSTELFELKEALVILRKQYGIQMIVTGATVSDTNARNLELLCRDSGLQLVTPLMGVKKEKVLLSAIKSGFTVVPLRVNLVSDSKQLLGKELSQKSLVSDDWIEKSSDRILDSVLVDGPLFSKRIRVIESRKIWTALQGLLVVSSLGLEKK